MISRTVQALGEATNNPLTIHWPAIEYPLRSPQAQPMSALIEACVLLSLAGPPQPEITYGFATSDYLIEMTVRFLNPYSGRRLVFYSSVEPEKPSQDFQQFVGAAAIVTYVVKLPDGKPPHRSAIRESVTVLTQSSRLPARPPFSKTQALVKGTATDLQVFGYDEAAIKKADRGPTRAHMRTQWRLYRQRLYVDQDEKPFAIVDWKHTLDRISIVEIYGPPP